ncbi:hypothetical protein NLG97_g7884 [Lecanicillium saksenae]|uniref:Uncharacterized protein n=1 Tax=Lecanicillium saksenae TaxID=468837 RepID=A0ACC1QNS0_9HYPO|nr:hypothetical protein NLG97_g7884 [Lecanicillium saksenae]
MKFTSFVTLITAALVSAEAQVPWNEASAWYTCTQNLVKEYNTGSVGDLAPCNLWDCLHKNALTYKRGGGITLVSNLLTPACIAAKANPGSWFPGFPGSNNGKPATIAESMDWNSCTRELLDEFDTDSTGNRAACNMWVCLHNQAAKYQRGGLLTTASNILTPICTAAGVILPN